MVLISLVIKHAVVVCLCLISQKPAVAFTLQRSIPLPSSNLSTHFNRCDKDRRSSCFSCRNIPRSVTWHHKKWPHEVPVHLEWLFVKQSHFTHCSIPFSILAFPVCALEHAGYFLSHRPSQEKENCRSNSVLCGICLGVCVLVCLYVC